MIRISIVYLKESKKNLCAFFFTYKMGTFGCSIKDGTLDIQHMFFVHKKICFSDIGKVTAGSKGELYLYDLGGKRLIKAGGLVGNLGLL